jgi:hypothetical protein
MADPKLGDLVSNLTFSQKEKKRIADLIKVNSRNKEIFLDHGEKAASFEEVIQSIQKSSSDVFGDFALLSKGVSRSSSHITRSIKKKVLKVLIEKLHKETRATEDHFFSIYRGAVSDYIIRKQKKLNRLLLKIKCDKKIPSSDDFFRLICENSQQYKVTAQVIEEFYVLWGFDRAENIDEFLALCNKEEPTQENEGQKEKPIQEDEEPSAFEEFNYDELHFPHGLPDHFSGSTKDSQKALKKLLGYNTGDIKALAKTSYVKKNIPNIKKLIKDPLKALHTIYATPAFRNTIYKYTILEVLGSVNTKEILARRNIMGVSFEFLSFNAYKKIIPNINNLIQKDTFHKRVLRDLIKKDPKINLLFEEIKPPPKQPPSSAKNDKRHKEFYEYKIKSEFLIKTHLLLWKYIKKDLKTWPSKKPEAKQTIINIIFSLSTVMDSVAPIDLSIELVPDLKNHFEEFLKADKKAAQVDSAEKREPTPDEGEEKISLPETNKQKQKKQPSAQILLEDFKKELIKFSEKEQLNWLTKNLINGIFKDWVHEHLLKGNDSPKLIKDINESNLHACDQLNKYIQHQEQKIKTREEVDKLESNLSSEPTSRKKERERVRFLQKQLADHNEAIYEIEDNFIEYASPTVDHPTDISEVEHHENHEINKHKERINQPIDKKFKNAQKEKTTKTKPKKPYSESLDKAIIENFIDKKNSNNHTSDKCQSDLFWLLINKGHSNYAYCFIESLENSGILCKNLPPASLVKAYALSDKITDQNNDIISIYFDSLKKLNENQLIFLANDSGDDEYAMRCLIISSMLQPAFFCTALPHQFLKVANNGFSSETTKFLNTFIKYFSNQGNIFFFDFTKNISPQKNLTSLTDIKKEIRVLKQGPRESGWDYWKTPAKILLNEEPFKQIISSIEANEISKVNEVSTHIRRCHNEKYLIALLQETQGKINRKHRSSHHPQKNIEGIPRRKFIRFFSEFFDVSQGWVDRCKNEQIFQNDRRQGKLNQFLSFIKDRNLMVLNEFDISNSFSISQLAGNKIIKEHLISLASLVKGDQEPFREDINQWLNFPKIIIREKDDKGVPSLALGIAKLAQSNFNYEIALSEFIQDSNLLGANLLFSEFSRTCEDEKRILKYQKEINSKNKILRKEASDKITFVLSEINDAFIQTLIDDFENNELLNQVNIQKEESCDSESNIYPDYHEIFQKLKHIVDQLVEKKSIAVQKLEKDYKKLNERTPPSLIIPSEWTNQFTVAIKENNINVIKEMLERYNEYLANPSLSLFTNYKRETNNFLDFLNIEKNLYEFIHKKKPGKEIISLLKSQQTLGPLTFDVIDPKKIDAIRAWNGLSDNNWKKSQNLSESDKSQLFNIFDNLGFKPINGELSPGQAFNQTTHLIIQFLIAPGESPVPLFGSSARGKSWNILLTRKISFMDIFQSLESFNIRTNEPIVLFIFGDLSPNDRKAFTRFCHKRSTSIILIDRLVFFFLISLVDNPSESSALKTLKLTLPFTSNHPYVEGTQLPDPEMVFGRKSHIDSLVHPKGAAMLYGGRQLGKTTILREVLKTFHKPDINQYGLNGGDLIYPHHQHKYLSLELWKKVGRELSSASLLEPKDNYTKDDIRSLLMENPSLKILFTFDEVDDFLNSDHQNNFLTCHELRQLVQETNYRFKVILAGHVNAQRFSNVPNFPLAQLGNPKGVGMMEHVDAINLIRVPLSSIGYLIDDKAIYIILSRTSRHPGLIQLFCYHLLKHLSSQASIEEINVPGYTITESDVTRVFENQTVKEAIKSRFSWTLALDPYWATISYGLCINGMENSEFNVLQAKEIGEEFWKVGFESKSPTEIHAILGEMINIGILLRKGENYCLRSHNVKKLLGTTEEVTNSLKHVTDHFKNDIPSQRHRVFYIGSNKKNSPLTLADEMAILGLEQDISSKLSKKQVDRKFSVACVSGSSALGINDIREALGSLGEFEGLEKNKDYNIEFLNGKNFENLGRFTNWIRDTLKEYRRKPVILIIEMPHLPVFPELFNDVVKFAFSLENKTFEANTRLIFLFGPESTWKWFGLREHEKYEQEYNFINLRRWDKTAIKQFLIDHNFAPSQNNVEFLQMNTDGCYRSLNMISNVNKKNVTENLCGDKSIERCLSKNFPKNKKISELRERGLEAVQPIIPILSKCVEIGSEKQISIEDIEAVIEIYQEDFDQSLLQQSERILKWLIRMGILMPLKEDHKYEITPTVLNLLEDFKTKNS